MGKRAFDESSERASGEAHHPRRKFVPTAELQEALRGVGWIDPDRFRRDIDAVLDQDPTPSYLR